MNIKEFRKAQGLSQTKLAEALGIGVSTVGGYEAGRINPSDKVIAKIKEIFNVDLNAVAPAKKAAPAKKTAEKKAPAKKAEVVQEAEVKPVKRANAKKPVKAAAKKAEAKAAPDVIIQSPMGGEITAADILARVGEVDKVYVRVDQNAAYWVKGEESGAVNLW